MAKSDYSRPDFYSRKARAEGFSARSVYKLQEMAAAERLFRRGLRVLDLGSAPGSWMEYASEEVGAEGTVVGVDVNPLSRPLRGNERFLQADVFALSPAEVAPEGFRFDLILSDMMSPTSGISTTDHFRSLALAERALALAEALLKPGGNFLVKVFQGPEAESFRKRMTAHFGGVKVKKPRSSRKASREVYFLGLGFRREKEDGKDGERKGTGASGGG